MAPRASHREPLPGRAALGFRPLYAQVRELLMQRIASGAWQPGDALPSEPELAAEIGVSQGTVRKALDEMEAQTVVVRRQGRGTYVAAHDDARILFQFFKLALDTNEHPFPESRILAVGVHAADARAAQVLDLRSGAKVVRIERVRSLAGDVCIVERIVLPNALFPRIERRELPNNLYELYRAQFGVTIARATERLKAVAAGKREAQHLGVELGAPLLSIDRTALAMDGRPVEWRVSLCRTSSVHYLSDLG